MQILTSSGRQAGQPTGTGYRLQGAGSPGALRAIPSCILYLASCILLLFSTVARADDTPRQIIAKAILEEDADK